MRKYQYPLLFHVEHKFPHWAAPCPEKGENWLFFSDEVRNLSSALLSDSIRERITKSLNRS